LLLYVNARRIFISKITGTEVIAALSRRLRTGDISVCDYHTAAANFEQDFQRHYSTMAVTDAVIIEAMRLAKHHPLRGYDSVQLVHVGGSS